MAKLQDIIKEKASRLSSVPEDLYTGIEEFQRFIFETLLSMLSELDSKNGVFIKSKKNFKIATDIQEELKKVMGGKEYLTSVVQFAKEFDTQKEVTDKYFEKLFSDFEKTKLNTQIMTRAKQNATELLTSATPKTEFLAGLSSEIERAISTQASWKDTVRSLRTIALGSSDVGVNDRYITPKDGKLLRYTKQIASDTLAIADRSYTFAIAQDLGAEWFLYFGDELPTSRDFCLQRAGKYFHKKEVESWAKLDWAGKMKDSTNETTIFVNCGGWRCQHSLLPVTIDQVNEFEREAIIRNIRSGNYEPTEFDMKEFDLPAA